MTLSTGSSEKSSLQESTVEAAGGGFCLGSAPPVDPAWQIGKHAYLAVRAHLVNGRTQLEPLRRRIPYQWHGGHYQDFDDQPFLLVHNSSGGFVEGDVAEFHLWAEAHTRTLITTTEATKFYKCESGDVSRECYSLCVGKAAVLEYLPDEVIPFAKSRIHRRTVVNLAAESRLLAWDSIAAGRVNYREGEAFAFSSLRSELEVHVAGRLRFLDRLDVRRDRAKRLASAWGGHTLMATVIAYAQDLPNTVADAIETYGRLMPNVRLGASVRDGLVCARVLGSEAWQVHDALFAIWQVLRPVIVGKPARPIVKC